MTKRMKSVMLSLRSILSPPHESCEPDKMLHKLSMTVKRGDLLLGKFVFDHLGLGTERMHAIAQLFADATGNVLAGKAFVF
jgi:hypothetical protein